MKYFFPDIFSTHGSLPYFKSRFNYKKGDWLDASFFIKNLSIGSKEYINLNIFRMKKKNPFFFIITRWNFLP